MHAHTHSHMHTHNVFENYMYKYEQTRNNMTAKDKKIKGDRHVDTEMLVHLSSGIYYPDDPYQSTKTKITSPVAIHFLAVIR